MHRGNALPQSGRQATATTGREETATTGRATATTGRDETAKTGRAMIVLTLERVSDKAGLALWDEI